MEDTAVEDQYLPTEYFDDNEDCERGLSRQPSFDTAKLTLKSSSSTGNTWPLRKRLWFALPHLIYVEDNNTSQYQSKEITYHDDGVDEDDDGDKKRFHETHKHQASKRRHNLIRSLLISALVVSSFCFLWSSKIADRMDGIRFEKCHRSKSLCTRFSDSSCVTGVTVRPREIESIHVAVWIVARCPTVETVPNRTGHQNKQPLEILLLTKKQKQSLMWALMDAILPWRKSAWPAILRGFERAYHEWMLDPVLLVGFLPLGTKTGSYSPLSDHALLTHKLYLDRRQRL
jgi:hypothetical protein